MPHTIRRLVRKDDKKSIGCIDAVVARLVAQDPIYCVTDVYGFSLHDGSLGLAQTFRSLAKRYDCIVLVDIGGDIMYAGKRDEHVLSPMFDAMVLRAFVDSGVPGILFEAGPGSDGELEPEALEESLSQAGAQAYPLSKGTMHAWSELYESHIAPIRPGNTVPMTLKAYHAPNPVLVAGYRARAHQGDFRAYVHFTQHIKTELCRNFYLIDPERITNPFAVECSDSISWFNLTQGMQHRTNCEANLEYVRHDGKLCQFLTPSPLFANDTRQVIISVALQDYARGACDEVWMSLSDRDQLKQISYDVSLSPVSGLVAVKLK